MRARVGVVLVAVLGLAACLAADLPGHFSVDSVSQLAQGRTGLYNDWHPPLMAWLLGLAARVSPHAAAFMIADAGAFFLALVAFAWGDGRPRMLGVAVMALIVATPQALIFQGIVWKDVLFADATLGGFAALILAGRSWGSAPLRIGSLGVAFVLFLVATLVRQTGFVAPLAGALVTVALAVSDRPMSWRRLAPPVLAVAGALAAMLVIAALATGAFHARNDGHPGAEGQLAMLQVFDLAGALQLDPGLPLDHMRRREPVLDWFERQQAAPAYRPGGVDFLDDLPGAEVVLPPAPGVMGPDWRRLIEAHPWLYLRVRAAVFWATLANPASQNCPVASVGVQTDDDIDLARAGLVRRASPRDEWDEDYVDAFSGTPVLSHLAWGVAAVLLFGLGLAEIARGERRPARLASAGLLACALAYAAGFFVVSVACDYRYLYLLDVAAMATALERAANGPFRQAARPRTAVARRSSLPQPTR
jgi:hypothetical protein